MKAMCKCTKKELGQEINKFNERFLKAENKIMLLLVLPKPVVQIGCEEAL